MFILRLKLKIEILNFIFKVRGTAISIKKQNSRAEVMKIVGVTISGHLRRNYTLYPGVDNKKRCITVSGAAYNDVPITYSVVGLEIHELPVIGKSKFIYILQFINLQFFSIFINLCYIVL